MSKPDSALSEPKIDRDDKGGTDESVQILKQPEEISTSVPPSKKPSLASEPEEEGDDEPPKNKNISKVSSKSVHLLLDNGTEGSLIVEPEKDPEAENVEIPMPPTPDPLPMFATHDSLELAKTSSQLSLKKTKEEDKECICEDQVSLIDQ